MDFKISFLCIKFCLMPSWLLHDLCVCLCVCERFRVREIIKLYVEQKRNFSSLERIEKKPASVSERRATERAPGGGGGGREQQATAQKTT
jgi:hypothetical protein